MKKTTTENKFPSQTPNLTTEDFSVEPSYCAFLVGFWMGYEVGKAGDDEPDFAEIESLYRETQQDLVFAIKGRPRSSYG